MTTHCIISREPFIVEYKSSTGRTKRVQYSVPLLESEIKAEEQYIVFDEEQHESCLVKIDLPTNEMYKNMLIASLSFIHPMKKIEEAVDSVLIKLFDCHNEEELNHKLDHLCEASSVDFSYRYRFV